MTERTLAQLQARLTHGDSSYTPDAGVQPSLILDILDSYVHVDDDGIAELAVLDDVTASAAELNILDGAAVTTAEINKLDDSAIIMSRGAGFSAAETYAAGVFKTGTLVLTRIMIDLTGVVGSATDLDIIGNTGGAASANIGQVTAALNGAIVGGRVTCLEVPAGGADDIDFYAATVGTGAQDGLVTDLTETVLITNGAAWTSGMVKGMTGVPAADAFLYVVNGEGSAGGTFTAGKFLIELFGYVALA